MPSIVIYSTKHYDWEPADPPADTPVDAPPVEGWLKRAVNAIKPKKEGDANDSKQAADGSWLQRVMKDRRGETTVSIPEAQIVALMKGTSQSRAAVIAMSLDKIMRCHAHRDHWLKIKVDGEPETEKFLASFFGLAQETK